jgi:hypothetical protein
MWVHRVEGDIQVGGGGLKGLVEMGQLILSMGWCGRKFTSLHNWLPPFFLALTTTHVLIIHYTCSKYASCAIHFSPLQVKNKPM